jgi:hypothetical protein
MIVQIPKFKFQNLRFWKSGIWNLKFGIPCSRYLVFNVFTIVITLSFPRLSAQPTQPARYEREHKSNDHDFLVISMREKGLALIRDTEKFEKYKKKWEVLFLDSTLQESWSTQLEVENRMNILGYEYRDGNIYLLFQEPDANGKEITLIEVQYNDRTVTQHKFKPEVNIRFSHFSILKNKAIFGGYINNEPALLMYDFRAESARVIPGIFQKKIELMDVRVNSNDSFNVLLVERSPNVKNLVVRTYDAQGLMLVDDIIPIEEGKSIVEAMTSTLIRDELVILGTWTYGVNKQAAGIFSVTVDPFTEQKVNYYGLTELNHFLDYLKPKRAARVKAKAERRKNEDKPVEFRAFLSTVKIEENKYGFSFLMEVYDPSSYYNPRTGYPYSQYGNYPNYYSPYGYNASTMPTYYNSSPYGYNSGSSSFSNDSRTVTRSALASFDGQGKLTADHTLKFQSIHQRAKEQASDFICIGDTTTLACKNEKEIVIQVNNVDGTIIKEEKIKPELKKDTETIRSESEENSSIRAWYNRYFYVYGYHTIKDNVDKTSRDVFYINKIKV